MRSDPLRPLLAALAAATVLALPGAADGLAPAGLDDGVRETAAEALAAAFPGAEVERTRHLLSKEQRAAIAKASGDAGFDARVAFCYTARDPDGEVVGYAYFDGHRVRTKRETLMVAVDLERRVLAVRVLAFQEPREYLPGDEWYAQFVGHDLDADLRLKNGIDVCTGATITSRVTTSAARRALALHAALFPPPKPVPPLRGGAPRVAGGTGA